MLKFGALGALFGGGSRAAETRNPEAKIPPAIAALSSMRSEVKPITVSERETRLARARELMAEKKIDAIFLAGGTTLAYFTGIRWGNSERLFATVIPAKGRSFCICPAFEKDRAAEQLGGSPLADAEVLTWQEDESPYELVGVGLKSRGLSSARIGIEERVPFVFSQGVAKANPAASIVSATPVTAGCRMIKSAHEIELMNLANQATLRVYKAVYESLQPGMTRRDAEDLVRTAYERTGFPGETSIEVGAYSASPHGSVAPQVIRESTIIMIDDGCKVDGYCSDITRSFVLGKASDKMKHVFDIVRAAQNAALAAVKVGAECQSVDAAARKVIVDSGFGPGYKFFTHRLGHGIGMDGHEWPYLVRGNTLALQPGMCFSDEPGIYIPGEFGLRLEDDMHVTPDGGVLFTPQSASLEQPFS